MSQCGGQCSASIGSWHSLALAAIVSVRYAKSMTNEHALLSELAAREIERLRELPQPIVRVCRPLTCDGPEGYERNAARLLRAEEVLEEQGNTVYRFGDAEAEIQGNGFAHDAIMRDFHEPILASGYIAAAYFLPRWEESQGARIERELCVQHGVEIREFPEEWFGRNQSL